jgi:hypothetical protein
MSVPEKGKTRTNLTAVIPIETIFEQRIFQTFKRNNRREAQWIDLREMTRIQEEISVKDRQRLTIKQREVDIARQTPTREKRKAQLRKEREQSGIAKLREQHKRAFSDFRADPSSGSSGLVGDRMNYQQQFIAAVCGGFWFEVERKGEYGSSKSDIIRVSPFLTGDGEPQHEERNQIWFVNETRFNTLREALRSVKKDIMEGSEFHVPGSINWVALFVRENYPLK